MLEHMRRLHPRGAANRGVCVDTEGAALGPDCVLVHRTATGYREVQREEAATVQRAVLDDGLAPGWLFDQSRRIAQALNSGQIALAQIYGLYIPINGLDDRQLRRLAAIAFAKAGFNPDEPRVPKGDRHGGEWTTGDGGTTSPVSSCSPVPLLADMTADAGGADGGSQNGGSFSGDAADSGGEATSSANPPIEYTIVSPTDAPGTPAGANPENAPTPETSGAPQTDESSSEAGTLRDHRNGDVAHPGPSETNPPAAANDKPPIEWTIDIPAEEPATTQQTNALLRSMAIWLDRAAAILGPAFELDPEVEAAWLAIEAASWLADYLPKVLSYLDGPKTLEELQKAVDDQRFGYEIHHIVEAQFASGNPLSNARLFPERINSPENLVRVPYWKHTEISAWYSSRNSLYGNQTPREYLRGKSWKDQYDLGLEALRLFGVLK